MLMCCQTGGQSMGGFNIRSPGGRGRGGGSGRQGERKGCQAGTEALSIRKPAGCYRHELGRGLGGAWDVLAWHSLVVPWLILGCSLVVLLSFAAWCGALSQPPRRPCKRPTEKTGRPPRRLPVYLTLHRGDIFDPAHRSNAADGARQGLCALPGVANAG